MCNFLIFKMGLNKSQYNYDQRLNLTELEALLKRVLKFKLRFGFKLLHNQIDCPQLLLLLNFKASLVNTRNRDIFVCPFRKTNFGLNSSAVNKIVTAINNLPVNLDIFNCNESTFNFYLRQM